MKAKSQLAQARETRRKVLAEERRRQARADRVQVQVKAIHTWWTQAMFQPAAVTAAEMRRRFGDAATYGPALRALGWTTCRLASGDQRIAAWRPPGSKTPTRPVKRRRLALPLKPPRLRRVR